MWGWIMPDFAVRIPFKGRETGVVGNLNAMGRAANKFGKKSKQAFVTSSIGVSNLKNKIKSLLPMFGVAGLGLLAKKGIELASDLTEVQNVVDTTFREGADQINKWSKVALKRFGLAELQAKQFTGTLGAMMKSSGLAGQELIDMSTKLTGLAGDYSSFFNLPIEEAFNKIRAGLSGETEPLKQIGKDMSAAGLSAFALSQGITKSYKAMSMAEKFQLRFSYLMSQSKDQMGDFNKTLSTSYANQKRVLGVQFDQFLANIMVKILPKLTELLKKLNSEIAKVDTNSIADGFNVLGNIIVPIISFLYDYKKVIFAIIGLKIALKIATIGYRLALMGVIGVQKIMMALGWIKYLIMMRSHIFKAIAATKAWTVVQKILNFVLMANPIGLIIMLIGLLVYKIYEFTQRWERDKDKVMKGLEIIKNAFASLGQKIISGLRVIGPAILRFLLSPINAVINKTLYFLDMAAKVPGIGEKFAKAAAKIRNFQQSMNSIGMGDNMTAPNQGRGEGNSIRFSGEININNAPTGTTVNSNTRGAARPINMNIVGVNP